MREAYIVRQSGPRLQKARELSYTRPGSLKTAINGLMVGPRALEEGRGRRPHRLRLRGEQGLGRIIADVSSG